MSGAVIGAGVVRRWPLLLRLFIFGGPPRSKKTAQPVPAGAVALLHVPSMGIQKTGANT